MCDDCVYDLLCCKIERAVIESRQLRRGCSKLNLGGNQVEALRHSRAAQGESSRKVSRKSEELYGMKGLERLSEGPSLNVLDEGLKLHSIKKKVRR